MTQMHEPGETRFLIILVACFFFFSLNVDLKIDDKISDQKILALGSVESVPGKPPLEIENFVEWKHSDACVCYNNLFSPYLLLFFWIFLFERDLFWESTSAGALYCEPFSSDVVGLAFGWQEIKDSLAYATVWVVPRCLMKALSCNDRHSWPITIAQRWRWTSATVHGLVFT